MDLMTGLAGISTALEGVKQLRVAYDKLNKLKDDVEAVDRERLMLELDKQILALEKDLHSLDRENHELKIQVTQIKENENLEFDEHFGTTIKVLENRQTAHFCTSCYSQKKILVQMPLKEYLWGSGYICPSCSQNYG